MDNGVSSYRRFLEGDDNGIVAIIRDYKDGLTLYLSGIVGDLQTAEDLAEDTFVKLVTKKPRFRGHASFKTWLYAIGRNIAVDFCRRRAVRGEISLDDCPQLCDEEEDLLYAYVKKKQAAAVHCTMRKLKREYYQVLWLTYFEDFSNKETAKIMGKSVHGIETLLYRARKSLKTKLDEEGFTYEEL